MTMRTLISNLANASSEQIFTSIFIAIATGLILIGGFAITQDHTIDCYYLSAYRDDGFTVHKVYSSINWQFDELAFASVDPKEALDVLSKLNQCAVK